MSPQTAEDGSLAFARNMKIDDDGNLVSDYGYKNISAMANYNIVGHIVGLDNKIYFFCYTNSVSKIVEYDENLETATELATNWSYSGGEIDGYVNTNQSGEKILTIGEYIEGGSDIPLKHINLSFAIAGDESFYSQAPKVPIANLTLYDTYAKTIPNGTYIFFIRYKIRKDVYTNWYLCSNPIFSGTSDKINTLQGGLKYINFHKDSAKSFIFNLSFVNPGTNNVIINMYEGYQLGFIITHDEATDARVWKTFSMNKTTIYFDYENVEEANIDDLLETTYELYNVRNITSFKNKLYISNYIESDFNPNLNSLVNAININYTHAAAQGSDVSYKNITFNGHNLSYDYSKGYYTCPSAYLTTQNIFKYSFTNFAKGSLVEKENILYFDGKWDSSYNPDLLAIHNMVNNTEGKVIFGNDFSLSFNGGKIGIDIAAGDGNKALFIPSSPYHPWYNKNLTFIYGSGDNNDPTWATGVKKSFLPFNLTTKVYYMEGRGPGWISLDKGFDDLTRTYVRSNVEKEISAKNRFVYGYCYITSGGNVYNLDVGNFNKDNYVGPDAEYGYSDFSKAGDITDVAVKNKCKDAVYNTIRDHIVGVDDNGSVVLRLYNESTEVYDNVTVNSVSVVFKSCEFKVESPESIGDNDDDNYNERFSVTLKSYTYTTLCSFNINKNYITITDNVGNEVQAGSLMPLSTYNAYIHFVDEHNIITNGIFKKQIVTGGVNSNIDKLLLNYSVSSLPATGKYKAFFISLVNVGNLIAAGFNYRKYSSPDGSNYHILNCLEVDALLYNINDDIKIIDNSGNTITTAAKYYTSGHSNPIIAFGNTGFIAWEVSGSEDYSNTKLYVSIDRNLNNEKDTKLFKATDYISLSNIGTTTVNKGFYNSYFCLVKKPSFDLASTCYVSGNDVYSASRNGTISLSDFDYYIQQQDTSTYFIISNFNLNYLSLTEDINDRIFSIGKAFSGVKQVAKVINSATLSFIYELKSMYKDFMNKTFKPYDTNKVDFDNTVRVSHVLSDETFNNSIFKFSAEDYYNVPTDRGIIVNLFAIGTNIFVHTKTAFYKFDGNQTIAASNNDITLQESEPFETGVTQLFDSEYGYGGIYNKEAGCITFDSYIFYDAMSNHIFAYGGNSQVQLIDASIYKMLCYYKPTYCRTLHDDANHRVLFEFTTDKTAGTYKTFTISYNYKSKSFVSLHDLSLVNAFHSRYISYSYKSSLISLFNETATIDNTALVQDMNVYKIYGNATTVCFIQFGADTQEVQSSPFNIAVVIFPQESYREVFNNLKYIGDVVKDNYDEKTNYEVIKFPQITRTNPVSKFYVITDRCVSTPVSGDVNDAQRPANPDDYKGFKFDMGSWNSNYFRNALNDTNIYQYPNQPGVDEPIAGGQTYTRHPNTDNNSLVYGKYFILVFDFIKNRPIKFEEVSVNSNQY